MGMAIQTALFIVPLTIALLMANAVISAREFPITTKPRLDLATRLEANKPRILELATRLEADNSNNISDCWTALSELRSCSNEIIGFFLNGQTDIDTPCCHAIEIITRHCWPSMLTILGFTVEEGNLLAGYCDKTSGPSGAPPLSEFDGSLF